MTQMRLGESSLTRYIALTHPCLYLFYCLSLACIQYRIIINNLYVSWVDVVDYDQAQLGSSHASRHMSSGAECRTFEKGRGVQLSLHAKKGSSFGPNVKKPRSWAKRGGGGGQTPGTPPPRSAPALVCLTVSHPCMCPLHDFTT